MNELRPVVYIYIYLLQVYPYILTHLTKYSKCYLYCDTLIIQTDLVDRPKMEASSSQVKLINNGKIKAVVEVNM